MGYTLKSKKENNWMSVIIISLFVVVCTVVVLISTLKEISRGTNRGNAFFVEIINSTMPIVKSYTFEAESLTENSITFKRAIMKTVGVDIYNPLEIIAKEITYIKNFNISFAGKLYPKEFEDLNVASSLDPFNFNSSNINRVTDNVDSSLTKPLDKEKKEVFIYHTHTREGFDNVPTNTTNNVVTVGDKLKKELEEKYGISVLHDTTIHDTTYNISYAKSRTTLSNAIANNGDFKLIIDLHRDSAQNKENVTTKINGKDVAKTMFVLGTYNQNNAANKSLMEKLSSISNILYPDYLKRIYPIEATFNQDLSPNAILVEVGSVVNTTDEAVNSAEILARIIAQYINGQ